jgi:hypothetical protein
MNLYIYELDNPYPLGVPNRVIEEYDEECESLNSRDPVFHMDCTCLGADDVLGMRSLLDTFLTDYHVHPDLIDVLVSEVGKAGCTKRVRWVDVGWNAQIGWHVLVARETDHT